MPITKDQARAIAGIEAPEEEPADAPLPVLSFEQIMAANDVGELVVPVPAWGGSVVIRGLTRAEFYAVQRRATVNGELNESRFEALLLEAAVVQPKMTAQQVTELRAKKGAASVGAVVKALLSHIGASKEAQQQTSATFSDER